MLAPAATLLALGRVVLAPPVRRRGGGGRRLLLAVAADRAAVGGGDDARRVHRVRADRRQEARRVRVEALEAHGARRELGRAAPPRRSARGAPRQVRSTASRAALLGRRRRVSDRAERVGREQRLVARASRRLEANLRDVHDVARLVAERPERLPVEAAEERVRCVLRREAHQDHVAPDALDRVAHDAKVLNRARKWRHPEAEVLDREMRRDCDYTEGPALADSSTDWDAVLAKQTNGTEDGLNVGAPDGEVYRLGEVCRCDRLRRVLNCDSKHSRVVSAIQGEHNNDDEARQCRSERGIASAKTR